MATIFMESGTDTTQGFQFWTSATATLVTSDSAVANTGPRSIKYDSGGAGTVSQTSKNSILADAGRRISFYIRFTNFPASTISIYHAPPPTGNNHFKLKITSGGVLQLFDGQSTGSNVQIGSDGSTLSTGVWYRICISYTITNSTTNEIRVYLNGNLDISVSDGANVGKSNLTTLLLGWNQAPGANKVLNIDDIYVDDSSALTDTGDIHVTAKLPNAENVNNFDTAIGSARGTTDYNNVNERALSETNGWRHDAETAVNENYGIQNTATGDEDLTGATLVARTGWVWAKRDTSASPIAFVNSATNQSKAAGTSLAITVPAGGWATGTSVIVTFASDELTNHPTCTDTAGNTYVRDAGGASSTSDVNITVFSSHNITALAAGNTVTVTHDSVTARAMVVANFTGLATSDAFDLDLGLAGSSDTPGRNNTTVTTTQADEVIIGAYGGEGPNGDIWGDVTTLSDEEIVAQIGTTGGGAATNITAFMMYRIVSSVDQWDTDASIDNSRDWSLRLASYKANVTVGTPKITNNGTDTAITLTTTSSLFTNIVDSATYPSDAAGIGMVSGGGSANTYFYEGGMLIAYIPGAGGVTFPSWGYQGGYW